MRSKLNKIASTAIFMLAITFATAAAQTWDGTADTDWYNPSATEFTITTAEQLAGLAQLVNDGDNFSGKTITLGNDIVLNNTDNWQNWEITPPAHSWTTISDFEGTFDGKGHVISGVYINSSSYAEGLFGYLYEGGTIKNLGVVASYITTTDYGYVGGLVGRNEGTVSNSYFIGTVTGEDEAGGLVGRNKGTVSNSYSTGAVTGNEIAGGLVGRNEGTVSNSYSTGAVTGNEIAGGLVGSNYGTVSNSYSTGTVTGTYAGGLVGVNIGTVINSYSTGAVTGNEIAGGLVGVNIGTVSMSYYDKETSGQTDTGKGEGKTTAEMQSLEFTESLNFGASILSGIQSTNAWLYSAGKYPTLSNTLAGEINIASYFASGDGTAINPYIITTKDELESLSFWVNSGKDFNGEYFKLGNDIALNNTENWLDWETTPPAYSWITIGNYGSPFNGTFNGNGYIISGVYINNAIAFQGLFGALGSGGVIKNLDVVESYIKSESIVGLLVGENRGTINNCHAEGTVTGVEFIGDLVGYNTGTGIVRNSYSYTGTMDVGYNGGSIYWDNIPAIIDLEFTIPTDHIYTGTPQGIGAVTGVEGIGEITVLYNGSATAPTDAGTYTVTVNIIEGIYFEAVTGIVLGEYTIGTIGKATPSLTNLIFTIPTGKVYTGSPQGIGSVTGAEGMGAITVLYSGSTTVPTNADTYAITVNIAAGELFEAATGIALGNYTIAKATAATPTGLTAVSDQTLADVTLPAGWYWEAASTTAVGAAGTQTHKATYAPATPTDAANYNTLTGVDVAITVTNPTPIISAKPETGGIIAQTIGKDIVLSNLPQNAKVEVFGLNGKRVYVGNSANSKILKILIQTKGVYIVRVGGQSLKVVVR